MKRKVGDILTRNVTTMTLEDTLAHAAKLMSERRISCMIVVKDDKPVGILTEADLVHIGHLDIDIQHTTIGTHLSRPLLTVDTEEKLYDAFECMLEHRARHLIVVNADGYLQGLLTFTDILNAAEFDDFIKAKPISGEMSRNITVLSPTDPLQDALRSMDIRHISCVVIIEDQKAVGIFSERDAVKLLASGDDLSSLIMSDVMSSPLLTMNMDESLLEASEQMHQHHFRRIVIVDDEQLPVGILTQFDVVRSLEGKRIMELKNIFAQTDAALSETRALLAEKNESEKRFRSLFEESRDMMHIIDIDGRIIDVNQAELDALGYSREEMIGKPVRELLMPDCIQLAEQRSQQLMQGYIVPLTELTLCTKHGKHLHVEISATPQFENGKVIAGRAILRDITERKQAEEKINALHNQYEAVANNVIDVLYMTDADSKLIWWNKHVERVTGLNSEQLMGMSADQFFVASDLLILEKAIERVLLHGEAEEQFSLNTIHGPVPYHFKASTLRNAKGEFIGITGVGRDISERKFKDALLARRERQLAVLAEAGKTINETLNESQITRRLVDFGLQLMACKSGTVGLCHKDSVVFSEYANEGQYHAIDYTFQPGYGVPGHVLATRQPYISHDTIHDPHVIPEIQQALGFKKLIDTPILDAHGEMLGCFEMHDRWDDADFDEQDLEMLQSLAGIVAAALVNARLLKNSNLQQQKIQQSAERMELILNADFDAIVVHQNFKVVFANTQAQQMFGYASMQETLGEDVITGFAPEYRKLAARIAKWVISRKKPAGRMEMMAISRLGDKPFPIEIASTPIQWEDKVAIVSIVRDVSERKIALDQLESERNAMHAMLNNLPFLAWLKDDKGRFLAVNDNFAKACGINHANELTDKTDLDIWPKATAETYQKADQYVIESAKSIQMTEQISTPEGSHWFETFKSPVFNTQGEVVGTTGMSIDISQRIENDQTMLLLESAVSAINESIIITNPEGTIIYVNPAFTRNTGYSPDDAIGKTPAILNSKQQSENFYQHFWQTLKAGKSWSGRIMDRRKDGTIFPVNLSVAPIFGANEEITHFVAVHEDLDPYEKLQKKMIQTQKMEAVGIMAGGMAHDFNNLLATLTGNLYLMRSHHKDNEEIVRRSKNMDISIQHGAKMIQQMLTFARKNSIAMHNIDLQSFIKEAHKLTQSALPENIKLTLNYDGETAWVHADPGQLQQVILNLVANARHALSDSRKPHIQLKLNHAEPPESLLLNHAELSSDYGWCCIQCQDNGCGISAGNLEHIFEPFFTTREVGGGTGLGLAMVYGAVQSHRGIIDVQSVEDKGTTFSIYLPLCKVGKEKVADKDDYIIDGNNRGVLIVDDNEQLREVLANVLRYNGFTVWEAADGELAISQYRKFKEKLSVILMDIVMPNMGGVAAAQEIRAMDQEIPIVFLTGYGEETQLHAASTIQHSSGLSKPIAMSDLIKTIEKQLHLKRK